MSAVSSAVSLLKKDGSKEPAPKNLKQSIFQKPLTWVIVAGVAIYFGSRLYKRYFKSQTAEEKKDINKLQAAGQKPTYLDSNYKQFADAIDGAGQAYNFFGTDEDAIYAVFQKMKNDLDIVKLSEAFGSRRLAFSLSYANLGGYLSDELDESELKKVNDILKSKGITYTF